jgi:hypothetical protein
MELSRMTTEKRQAYKDEYGSTYKNLMYLKTIDENSHLSHNKRTHILLKRHIKDQKNWILNYNSDILLYKVITLLILGAHQKSTAFIESCLLLILTYMTIRKTS